MSVILSFYWFIVFCSVLYLLVFLVCIVLISNRLKQSNSILESISENLKNLNKNNLNLKDF
jgi:hypothetical protein